MAPNQRRHVTNKTAARSQHTTIVPQDIQDDDEEYKRHVEKLEAVQESRGAYILGQGALDKNDAVFLLEEEEKRLRELKRKAETEKHMFAEMVAKARSSEISVGRHSRAGEVEVGLGRTGRAEAPTRKRVKNMVIRPLTGHGSQGAKTGDRDTEEKDDSRQCVENDGEKEGGTKEDVGVLQGLLGAYEDEDESGSDAPGDAPATKQITLPCALDLI